MGEIVVVPLGRRNACRRPKIAENRRRHARRASPDARKGFFESLSRPHSHARPHERRRGTHGVHLDPSVERSRRQRSSRRRRAPTARGPGSQRHAVDFGFVENLLRRRACSLPAAEVSPALARDAIGAAASRARGGAERLRPSFRTRTRRTFPRPITIGLSSPQSPRANRLPFGLKDRSLTGDLSTSAIIKRLSIERNSRKKTFDVVLLLLQDAGREADHG